MSEFLKTDPGIYNEAIWFQDYTNSRNSIHAKYLSSEHSIHPKYSSSRNSIHVK